MRARPAWPRAWGVARLCASACTNGTSAPSSAPVSRSTATTQPTVLLGTLSTENGRAGRGGRRATTPRGSRRRPRSTASCRPAGRRRTARTTPPRPRECRPGPTAAVLATPSEAYVGDAPATSFGAIVTKFGHSPKLGRPRARRVRVRVQQVDDDAGAGVGAEHGAHRDGDGAADR